MASPVGHSLMGLGLYLVLSPRRHLSDPLRRWKTIALYIFLANLPDVDFLVGFLFYGRFNILHGEMTHNASFLIITSLLFATLCQDHSSLIRSFFTVFLLIGSHDLMDFLSSQNLGLQRAYGIAFFYPFSQEKIGAPFSLFYGVRHKNLEQLFSLENLWTIMYELCVFLPVLALIYVTRRPTDSKMHE
ncbi:MAG: metal-dependent hydrolase [Gammaproteobacteria bacterium]